MSNIYSILFLILPIVLAGVLNMIFVKSACLNFLKTPMDGGRRLADGKRLFGDNKTWKGFAGMIVFTCAWFLFFGMLYEHLSWFADHSLIPYNDFTIHQQIIYGALWGLGYVLFELPNSYAKRRIDIEPGKTGKGTAGFIFSFIDQADSVIGCLCALFIFYVPSLTDLMAIFGISVLIHYLLNVLLYLFKLKSQPL